VTDLLAGPSTFRPLFAVPESAPDFVCPCCGDGVEAITETPLGDLCDGCVEAQKCNRCLNVAADIDVGFDRNERSESTVCQLCGACRGERAA